MEKVFIICNENVRQNACNFISMINVDGDMEVVIRKHKTTRSLRQNNLLWKWLTIIRDEYALAGNKTTSTEVWLEYFGQLFLPVEDNQVMGQAVRFRKSTRKLSVAEMAEFLTKIEAYCATDMGIFLPSPQDLGRDYAI